MSGEGESLQELSRRLQRLEQGDTDVQLAPTRRTFLSTQSERELAARLARRELARKEDEARSSAAHKRRRRREKLTAELHRAQSQLDERLAQHERARQKLLADHQGPIAEAREGLREIDAEVLAAAELVRTKVRANV
jgi:hypothetical protein